MTAIFLFLRLESTATVLFLFPQKFLFPEVGIRARFGQVGIILGRFSQGLMIMRGSSVLPPSMIRVNTSDRQEKYKIVGKKLSTEEMTNRVVEKLN